MYLDNDLESALNGEKGGAQQWAMEVLVRLGDRSRSPRMIPVSSIHIPGWCGQGPSRAWNFIGWIAGQVKMPITANPGGSGGPVIQDRMAILEGLVERRAYSFTCAPYLSGNHPVKGSTVAWGGRAASAFANSVLGARTEVETFESSVASAITGLTPERRWHREEEREPTIAVVVVGGEDIDYAALGWAISRRLKGEVPLICGASPTFDQAKRLAFSLNADGDMPLFHLQRAPVPSRGYEVVEIDVRSPLTENNDGGEPDLIVLGCPHLSEQEINRWSTHLAGRVGLAVETWFFTSQLCLDKSPKSGAVLSSRGKVFTGTCPLASSSHMKGRKVACGSPALAACLSERGVAASYLPDGRLRSLMEGRR